MRQMAAEARQGQGSAASDPPRPRQREAEPAEPPLEFPSCETTNGRRLMTLQDSAEAIGMIPSSWNAAKPNEDSGKSQSTAGPRGTEAVTQAPQAPLAKQGPAGAGPARQDPPIVLILDADGQLRRCPLLEGRVVAVIAAQDVSRASMPALVDRAFQRGRASAGGPPKPPPAARVARLTGIARAAGSQGAQRPPDHGAGASRGGAAPPPLPARPGRAGASSGAPASPSPPNQTSLAQRLLATTQRQGTGSVEPSGADTADGFAVPVRPAVVAAPASKSAPAGAMSSPKLSIFKVGLPWDGDGSRGGGMTQYVIVCALCCFVLCAYLESACPPRRTLFLWRRVSSHPVVPRLISQAQVWLGGMAVVSCFCYCIQKATRSSPKASCRNFNSSCRPYLAVCGSSANNAPAAGPSRSSADDLIDACSFNDWSYEEAVENLARDMGQSRQLVEARIAEVLGVNQPRDGRKRGRPPNSR